MKGSFPYHSQLPLRWKNHLATLPETSPLVKQFLPSPDEINPELQKYALTDPLFDHKNHVAPQIIHRYKNRVLFTPTASCPITCRYCFRKNELNHFKADFFEPNWFETKKYLLNNSNINELIFTGGDPLQLSKEKLTFYLEELSEIPHLTDMRFHSRVPVIQPEVIHPYFFSLLNSFKKRFRFTLVIHTNHAEEWFFQEQFDFLKSCQENASTIRTLSQSVLLKNVNDSTQDLFALFHLLQKHNVQPYYLHHPDFVKGAIHFCLTLNEGYKIYQSLRDILPGHYLPHYVVESLDGSKKILVAELVNSSIMNTYGPADPFNRKQTSLSKIPEDRTSSVL